MRKLQTPMTILKDIYTSIFGKDYGQIWRQFALDNNGKFIEANDGNESSVEIVFLSHKIIFDRYIDYRVVGDKSIDTEFTRIRLEFVSPDNLRLRVMRQGLIDNIGKLFGAQDIRIGDKVFDKKFMIKGNDEFKIQQIFSNNLIKECLLPEKDIVLQVLDNEGIFNEKIKEGNSMLYYISEEIVTSLDRLNTLLNLYKALVDQMTKLGSARPIKASA